MSAESSVHRNRLVYGCMGLGGDWSSRPYTAADVDEAAEAIEAALAIGITVFDHADIYRSGKSEAVFGEVLARSAGLRDRIQLQTKCGIRLNEDGLAAHYNLDRAAILERVNGSLQRLQTDYVDVLLLHRPDPLMEPAEVAATFAELRADGKVRRLGVSNMSAAQIDLLQSHLDEPLVVNQLEMSLRKRDWVESGILVNHAGAADYSFPHGTVEHCMAAGIRLQAWGSLAQGRYTGSRAAEPTDAEQATARLVASMAEQKATTGEAIVLGWLMRHPAGIEPVIGSRDPERIRACGDAVRQAELMTRVEWYDLWTTARGSVVP